MKKSLVLLFLAFTALPAFFQEINKNGNTIIERFSPPPGYERIHVDSNSFADYLRICPLKKYGSPVLLYNGQEKRNKVHVSVFDMPLLSADLIQCADAVIKLRAEYLYSQKRFSEIKFHITNGMLVPFERYSNGEKVIVAGNDSVNKSTGKKIMLLGQSYEEISPWNYVSDDILETPEWTFYSGSLKGF